MNPVTTEKGNKTELKDIFKSELEIGYAETENGIVKVSCKQYDWGICLLKIYNKV